MEAPPLPFVIPSECSVAEGSAVPRTFPGNVFRRSRRGFEACRADRQSTCAARARQGWGIDSLQTLSEHRRRRHTPPQPASVTLSKKTFPGRACSSLFPLQYSKCDMQLSSAAPETALFLCDENIGRKFEPGTQFAHLAQGELSLGGQEHRNRTLRSELRDQIPLCKSLLFNQESHH